MPRWTTEPPKEQAGFALRILRTPQAKPILAIVTSTDVLGCNTHYVHHRTLPCEGHETCEFCQEGHSWRWHGYLAAMLQDTLEHVIFEFTATASTTFANYQALHQNMRGCLFRSTRPSGKTNGRVVIHCRPADTQRTRLPEPPDVKKILCHIWNIPNSLAEERHIPDRLGNVIKIDRGNGHPTPQPAA
jgi:hypothetical protein